MVQRPRLPGDRLVDGRLVVAVRMPTATRTHRCTAALVVVSHAVCAADDQRIVGRPPGVLGEGMPYVSLVCLEQIGHHPECAMMVIGHLPRGPRR